MDILKASVAQHHEVILEAVQSETFKKIVAAGTSGLEVSSKSKVVAREPDALYNLLVLQLVEHDFPRAEGWVDADQDEDEEPWDLLGVSPEGVEIIDLEEQRLYRCAALGHAAWRVVVGLADGKSDTTTLRESLKQLLAAEWRLHCLLDKIHWNGMAPDPHLLRRLEVIWSEFVALIDRDVQAIANEQSVGMAPETRKEMVRLRKALNTIESARLAKPSDAALDALAWIKQLVENWALRVVVEAQDTTPKEGKWTKALAQEWFKAQANKHGETLSSTDIKRIIKEDGGPSWGLLYKTTSFKAYMALRKLRAAGKKRGPSGKRVSLDHAHSALASTHDAGDRYEIEQLVREQEAELAEEHRPRDSPPKR